MSYCCTECFNDKIIKNDILKSGHSGKCSYCNAIRDHVIDILALKERFLELINFYKVINNNDSIFGAAFLSKWEINLFQGIQKDWDMFIAQSRCELILSDLFKDEKDSILQLSANSIGRIFPNRSSLYSEYGKICFQKISQSIIFKNRFLLRGRDFEDFESLIKTGIATFKNYEIVDASKIFYRARIHDGGAKYKFKDLKAPPFGKANSGRANPKGIPYLYLASDVDTAINEVRPPVKTEVCYVKFNAVKKLRILDLGKEMVIESPFVDGFKDKLRYRDLLNYVAQELNKPVLEENSEFEYLPTQYLCEYLKSLRSDDRRKPFVHGVKYKSNKATGDNYVLFGVDSAKPNGDIKKVRIINSSIEYCEVTEN
ncbi:MAG: RES family NAD+ phosphorylase [Deferribacterales bacterium]